MKTVQDRVDKIVEKDGVGFQYKLENLWFVFGNHGPAHTMANHKYVQRHVEGRFNEVGNYPATETCKAAVARVMALMPPPVVDAAERAAIRIAKDEQICPQEFDSAVRLWTDIIREEIAKDGS